MIYGYIRVSTDRQNTANQRHEIEKFAAFSSLQIDRWVEETVSTRKGLQERRLGRLLGRLQKGDILIATELSRLGRNMLEVMGILQHCLEKDCQIWTLKENYRLGADIQSKVLAFAFSRRRNRTPADFGTHPQFAPAPARRRAPPRPPLRYRALQTAKAARPDYGAAAKQCLQSRNRAPYGLHLEHAAPLS